MMLISVRGLLVKNYTRLFAVYLLTTCATIYIFVIQKLDENDLARFESTFTRARNSDTGITKYLIRSKKIQRNILTLKTRRNAKASLILKEFEIARYFFRPALTDLSTPLDFDEYSDDRIQLQREWIVNMTTSHAFASLKPKRILAEFEALPQPRMLDGGLHCDEHENSLWEKKCILEIDPPEMAWNDTEAQANRNLDKYDAVIETRLWFVKKFVRKIPKSSSTKQILVTMESSYHNGPIDFSLNNAFLASYWRGSDISIPYAKWIPFQQEKELNSNLPPTNYAQGKTKLAATLVSNCQAKNDRLRYVNELQRYVDVDIYGKCTGRKCAEGCRESLGEQYKFYLAFENANCRDYITEKVFQNALEFGMVPVVLGAEKRDYLYALPPNSFIHVEDFTSPLELSEYLKKLDANDTLYNEYFRWKNTGKFVAASNDLFCRVCALLHLADFVKPPVWPKGSTWDKVNVCLPSGRWYWHRPNPENETKSA